MAEVTSVVCDLCGRPAEPPQRTIDVCEKHGQQIDNRVSPNGGSPTRVGRYHASGKSPCPYCGAGPYHPQGMAQHISHRHPERLTEWRKSRETERQNRHSRVGNPCDYCGLPFQPQGMAAHVRTIHAAKYREWQANHPSRDRLRAAAKKSAKKGG